MADDTENPIDVKDPFARRLILQYVKRRKAELDTLRSALAAGRFRDIQITGHNMSGSGSAYGLDRISEIGARMEAAAKAGQGTEVERLISKLDSYVHTIRLK